MLSPQDQEAFFANLKAAHPGWSPRFISGYIHGMQDEGKYKQPRHTYVREAGDLAHYALGYLLGFAMHRGIDCETESWYGFVGTLVAQVKDCSSDEKTQINR